MSDMNVSTTRSNRVGVISWNNGSSARALSEALSNGKFLKKDSSPLPRSVRAVINMGCKAIEREGASYQAIILNHPSKVQLAGSKINTLQRIANEHPSVVPKFWIDPHEAIFHAVQNNFDLVCRTIDAGHSGSGIVLVTQEELQQQGNVPRASVYVQAIKKRREYRVHVGKLAAGMGLIDIARKVRRAGVPDGGVNGDGRPFIWNHGNDFIFQRSGIDLGEAIVGHVVQRAKIAVRALGLDFGAVDVVVEAGGSIDTATAYVLEVNTAPGMEGTTLERYINFFNYRINGGLWNSLRTGEGEEYENGGADEEV